MPGSEKEARRKRSLTQQQAQVGDAPERSEVANIVEVSEDELDDMLEQTFPASDPPKFDGSRGKEE